MSEQLDALDAQPPADDDAQLQAEHAINYMANVWLPEGRCYVIRRTGGGENVLRAGDVIEEILRGTLWPPEGPVWVSAQRRAQLTEEEIEQLLARGVTAVNVIPETVCRPTSKVEKILAQYMETEAIIDELQRRIA